MREGSRDGLTLNNNETKAKTRPNHHRRAIPMGARSKRNQGGNPRKGRGWKVNKHTPGPWIARNLSKGIWTVEAGSPHVHGKIQEVCRIAGPWNPENYRRNARLIASAPELLEALGALLTLVEDEGVNLRTNAYKNAQKAIAKARGES